MILRMGSGGVPTAPPEIRDEVELYARQSGRTGSIVFVPPPGHFWEVRLSLKPNDPRMKAWQEGTAPEPPMESIALVEPNPDAGKVSAGRRQGPYRALDILQMGASGVRAYLEKGDTWSGRGEHASVADSVRTARDNDEQARQRTYESALDDVKARAREERPWYAKRSHERIARQVVPADLTQTKSKE